MPIRRPPPRRFLVRRGRLSRGQAVPDRSRCGAAGKRRCRARSSAQEAVRHAWVARLLRSRIDPGTATGLALTLALGVAILGGLVVGVLAYLVRSSGYLIGLDASVGDWAADHATDRSTQLLQLVTDLASAPVAIAVILVVMLVEMMRAPSRWLPPFLITVFIGEVVLVNSIKGLLDRARPTFNPVAATLGPVVPERPLRHSCRGLRLRRTRPRAAQVAPRARAARRGGGRYRRRGRL